MLGKEHSQMKTRIANKEPLMETRKNKGKLNIHIPKEKNFDSLQMKIRNFIYVMSIRTLSLQ